ncbi:MAG TPA: PLP-dependent lyase/thiolase [Patescibacteria group bacterium]|nr:PLP-dependent lyase/thiolase [Patescibacteria group bacterium]
MPVTPLQRMPKLEQALNLPRGLYFKREDLHPLGSHKGRSIPLMIEHYLEQDKNNFVISSSGNAALAAALYVKKYNKNNDKKITLTILVGEKINQEKFSAISEILDNNIQLKQVTNPKQLAFQTDKDNEAKNLRQSTDDISLIGYEELAKEIVTELPDVSAIFVPTSSGTTALGLHLGFKKLGVNPEIHIVQTDTCHTLINNFKKENIGDTEEKSLADAIVDQIGHRKITVRRAVSDSHGQAWIAENEELKDAIILVKQGEKLKLSPNSALSLVGLRRAIKKGEKFSGPVVCLITGR